MAYVDPGQETPGPAVGATQQAPISSGGAGVAGSSKAAATPGQNVPAQPSAQLSAYLNANQPQSAAFGQNVASTVGNQVNAAGAAINPAVNTYTGQLYTVPTDATVNNAVATSPSSLSSGVGNHIAIHGGGPTSSPGASIYEQELGAAANAPSSASTFETSAPYQNVAQGIQGAVDQANLWNSGNSVANLSTALRPFEGTNATSGDSTLDSLLLSQTPGAYSQIQAAVAPAANLQNQLAAGTTQADAALQGAIAQDTATTSAANQAAQTYASNLNSTLAQYLASAQGNVSNYNNSITPLSQNLASVQPQIGSLEDAVSAYNAALAGGAGTAGIPLNGPQFSPISVAQPGQIPSVIGMPTAAQVATPDQFSDIAALQSLLGSSAFSGLNTSITPDEASQAGTYNPPNGGNIPSLAALLDPVSSSVIPGLNQNFISAEQFAPDIQASAPLSQDLQGVSAALDALLAAENKQPYASPTGTAAGVTTPPPQGATPGSAAYDAWLESQYPGLNIPGYNPTTGTVTPTSGYRPI